MTMIDMTAAFIVDNAARAACVELGCVLNSDEWGEETITFPCATTIAQTGDEESFTFMLGLYTFLYIDKAFVTTQLCLTTCVKCNELYCACNAPF